MCEKQPRPTPYTPPPAATPAYLDAEWFKVACWIVAKLVLLGIALVMLGVHLLVGLFLGGPIGALLSFGLWLLFCYWGVQDIIEERAKNDRGLRINKL